MIYGEGFHHYIRTRMFHVLYASCTSGSLMLMAGAIETSVWSFPRETTALCIACWLYQSVAGMLDSSTGPGAGAFG